MLDLIAWSSGEKFTAGMLFLIKDAMIEWVTIAYFVVETGSEVRFHRALLRSATVTATSLITCTGVSAHDLRLSKATSKWFRVRELCGQLADLRIERSELSRLKLYSSQSERIQVAIQWAPLLKHADLFILVVNYQFVEPILTSRISKFKR